MRPRTQGPSGTFRYGQVSTHEPLEDRRLMAATPLVIQGTGGADAIRISQSGTTLTVSVNGDSTSRSTGAVSAVVINGGEGADVIRADFNVQVPLTLNGGGGDDRLRGGAGRDTLRGESGNDHLSAGAGNDTLDGGSGDDVLVSIGGTGDADRLTGSSGRDHFWADPRSTDAVGDATSSDATDRVGSFYSYRIARSDGSLRTVSVPAQLVGQDLADPVAGGEYSGWKDFSDKPLFPRGGPTEHDLDQNGAADCYLLAALAATAKVAPQRIIGRVADLGDGTYAVHFQSGSSHHYVRVDGDLPVKSDGKPHYAGLGRDGAVWAPVIEKAWAFFRRGQGTYASINFGWARDSFKALGVADVWEENNWQDFGSAAGMLDAIDKFLDRGDAVTFWTKAKLPSDTKLLYNHVLTVSHVVRNDSGVAVGLVLRDPRKIDLAERVDGANDGYITLTAAQAAASMNHLTWCHP